MSEATPNPTPETTPPVAPTAPAATTPAAAPAPSAPGDKGRPKRPFATNRPPKPDRPKLDFAEISTGLKINQLDAEIENELAAAMSGFESALAVDTANAEEAAAKLPAAQPGGRKKGRIISIHGNDVFIDVPGGRSQGYMPLTQFEKAPKVGDEVDFAVEGYDGANGVLKLTRSGSAIHVDWSSVQIGQTVEARIMKSNKGGLEVEVNGIRGFLPISQIDIYRVENVEQFVNQRLLCMVAEVNPSEKNLVVSRKALLEREREQLREKFWATVEQGQVLKGVVRSLQPFGAFVDLGGADGLLPVSELAWGRVEKPGDLLSLGQSVEVKVMRLDTAARKLTLSLKAMAPSPWDTINQRFPVGTRITGKVTRVADFGAFVEIEPGVEGMIHISEMALGKVRRVRDLLQEGKEVEAQILTIDKENRRIGLSLRAIAEASVKAENEAAAALMASRETSTETAEPEEEIKPRKRTIPLRGGK